MSWALAWTVLGGCAHAWVPGRAGTFDLDVPQGWSVTRNYRWFGNAFLTIEQNDAAIGVQVIRETPATRRVPLDLVAEARVLTWGRTFGVENQAHRAHHIVLDGHEAWAVSGLRRWKFADMQFSTVVTRAGRHAVLLTVTAPPSRFAQVTPSFGAVLDSFRLPLHPIDPAAPLFEPDP